MSDIPVRVSDHALLRYMQRVLGMDVEQLRGHIAESVRRHQGAPSVRVLGARFLLRDGVIVTTIDHEPVPSYDMLVRLIRETEGGAA
ncbi:hypothetical protein LJR234_000336 [Mesorhizobium amorphae]|uniref:hypothetical protein n=1 Tax=Mesorhizobium amorphae TaxID=71433 RepID=UPI003ECD3FAB